MSPRETPRVDVPVLVDSGGLQSVTNNLGYEVSVTEAHLAMRDLEFAVAGEMHASLGRTIAEALVPTAWAHPGHYQGGDITGELLGSFLLHFEPNRADAMGTATLLVGDYRSANFFFRRGNKSQSNEDVLDGHTCVMRGVARRDDEKVEFRVMLDSPEDRQLVGAPFEQRVEEGAELVVGLRLLVQDLVEGETLFDDVDFFTLNESPDEDVVVGPGSDDEEIVDAYNQILRRFQSHNHFEVRAHEL